jgi:hypothetical protein
VKYWQKAMPLRDLITTENLRSDGAKAGAIVTGFFGLIAVLVTNIDKIVDAYRYFTESVEARQAEGPWLGIFQEYDDQAKKFIVSNESVNLKSSLLRLGRISGSVDSTAPILRHHDITGSVSNDFLITEYRDANPTRGGAVVYLLKGSVASGTLEGFWSGYDPDAREVMSCPYVLTRQIKPVEAQNRFREWLNKECVGKNSIVSANTGMK